MLRDLAEASCTITYISSTEFFFIHATACCKVQLHVIMCGRIYHLHAVAFYSNIAWLLHEVPKLDTTKITQLTLHISMNNNTRNSNKRCQIILKTALFYKNQETWLEAECSFFSMVNQSQNITVLFLFKICIICFVHHVCYV